MKLIKYISSAEAIEICREKGLPLKGGRKTIAKWRKQYNLGRKVGGRLQIDEEKLLKFLEGENGEEEGKTKKKSGK